MLTAAAELRRLQRDNRAMRAEPPTVGEAGTIPPCHLPLLATAASRFSLML